LLEQIAGFIFFSVSNLKVSSSVFFLIREKQLVDAAIYRFEKNTGAVGKGFPGPFIWLERAKGDGEG
jgi:hypothetical protein